MREQILELFKDNNKALTIIEINDKLNLKTVEELNSLTNKLDEMEYNLDLRKTNKGKYVKHDDELERKGIVLSTKSDYAFVKITDDKGTIKDVYVHASKQNGAIHGDTVVVKINKIEEKPDGTIIRILKRDLLNVVGEIVEDNGVLKLIPDDQKIRLNIIINNDKSMGAMPGHKVLVKLGPKVKDAYICEVLVIIGHKNDPGIDILSIVYKYGIEAEFNDDVEAELNNIPDEVNEEEIYKRKEHDLRSEMIFTIDGDDTKDIDDAIGIEKLTNGNYKLGVHIADVSYYVKEKTALYDTAMDRGTSVYLADRVIPMLPHKLSNGICSLNPNVDRLAISCVMEINEKGKIISHDIFESIIKSRKQMTYKNVNKILEQNLIPEGYEEFADKLHIMKDLADILRNEKIRRGYIDFDIDESKIIVDETGKAIDVILRERGMGEKLIEDFMIAANECVAEHIEAYKFLPFIYRIHGEPSEEKIKQFIDYVAASGYKLTGKFTDMQPSTMQKILEQLKDKKEFHIFSTLLLRCMQKAVYDTNNIGHFGLGSKCYTHFTSPIRRFPDTTVHRLLRKYVIKGEMDNSSIKYEEVNLPAIALHSSKKERDSVDCEREVDDMKKAEYMKNHIGEIFSGMISTITNRGMYVELPNLIEGMIRIEDLNDDHYSFDESTIRLIGKNNKRGYHLGDTLEIIVKDARKEVGEIDFVINNEENKKQYFKLQ